MRLVCTRRCRDGGTARTRCVSEKLEGPSGSTSTSVGAAASSRRATVRVGETWNEVEVSPSAATATEDEAEADWSFSFALPPMAVGALWVVLLLLMYTPRPIPPAMHYKGVSRPPSYARPDLQQEARCQ